jgi:hypothetical protein
MITSVTTRALGVTATAICAVAFAAGTASATTAGHDGRIAFNRGGDIYTAELNGTGLKRLTTNRGGNGWPNWSPDGSRIAWVHNGQVWLMNADGSGKKKFAVGTSPSWSPDGRTIAFAGVDSSDKSCGSVPVIFSKPVAGGARKVIDNSNYAAYCSWGSQEFTFGDTTAWYGGHVEYGYSLYDEEKGPDYYSYGVEDDGRQVVTVDTGEDEHPAPDVDTSPARPNVVWTGDGGVQVDRIDGTFHKTVVSDPNAYAPKYDPANTAIFYSTKTAAGRYEIKQVGLTPGSTPTTVLSKASQPDVQPVG